MENPNYSREIDEAIRVGQQARDSLLRAKDCFSSAADYSDLKQFGKELTEVDTIAEFQVETGDFFTFAAA